MSTGNGHLPAYPFECIQQREFGYPKKWTNYLGLTKRERYAMAAMQGLLAADWHDCREARVDRQVATICRESVRLADALITELEKPR